MIDLSLDTPVIAVGNSLTGTCTWTPENKEKSGSRQLQIGWKTEGKGNRDQDILYQAEIKPGQVNAFSCQIPRHGPVSYQGCHLSIVWEVTVSGAGFLGLGRKQITQTFRVIPRQLSPAQGEVPFSPGEP